MLKSIIVTGLFTVCLFTAVLYVGCTKTEETDKCADVKCKYGTCTNGICYCNAGYTGTLCDKKICEVNKTSRVRFQNKTGSSLTYAVVWDGSTMTTLGPGQTSDYFTVAAGAHIMHFMVANTNQEACTQSSPVLTQCMDHEYWCTK